MQEHTNKSQHIAAGEIIKKFLILCNDSEPCATQDGLLCVFKQA